MKKLLGCCSILVCFSSFSNDLYADCPNLPPNSLGENIMDHGAIPDDTLDDSTAVQCALDLAMLHSKKVIIPAGDFIVAQEIFMKNNFYNFVQIEGVGWSSIIKHTGGDFAFRVGDDVGSDPSSVVFRNFWIKNSGYPNAHGAILYHHAHRALVDHMRIDGYSSSTAGDDGGAAITYRNTWIHTVKDTIINGAYNGIYAKGGAHRGSINSLNVQTSDFEGVRFGVVLAENASVNIRDNTIEGNDIDTAILCHFACKGLAVTGNYFEAVGTSPAQAVFVGNSAVNSGIVIQHNYANISHANSYFEIRNARGLDVTGNTLVHEPINGGAYIKIGRNAYVAYFDVNNNFAGKSDGNAGEDPSWGNVNYVAFVDPDTGAFDPLYKGNYGTLFDNKSKSLLYGTNTDFGQM